MKLRADLQRTKAKKIKEQLEEIEEKISNIKDNCRFYASVSAAPIRCHTWGKGGGVLPQTVDICIS